MDWRSALRLLPPVLALGLIGPASVPAPAQPTPAAAETSLATRGRLEAADGLHAIGAFATMPNATIARLHVAEGDAVRAGQLLVTLSHAELAERQVAASAAAVVVAARRLELVRRPWREPSLAAARAVMAARAADLSLAERQLGRTEDLLSRGVRADADRDQRRSEAERARAQLREAEAQLAGITGVSAIEIEVAAAELAEAEARRRQAEAERDLATIRAPADGTVVRLLARAGDIASGRVILEIADLARLKAVAEVEERLLPRLAAGQAASIGLPGEERRWPARVRRIGQRVFAQERPAPDQLTARGGRMVEVELALGETAGLPPVHGLELLVRFP